MKPLTFKVIDFSIAIILPPPFFPVFSYDNNELTKNRG